VTQRSHLSRYAVVRVAAPAVVFITFSLRDDRDACLARHRGLRSYFKNWCALCKVPRYKVRAALHRTAQFVSW
jgi:hypothetical protein